MAQGIITIKGREKLCKAHAGDIKLPKITHMVFGSGGIDNEGNVKVLTGNETTLTNKLITKPINEHEYPVPTTCRYKAILGLNDLAGEQISEIGLIDEDGDLVAYKTFGSKFKDVDMEFIFDMEEIF